MPVFDCTFDKDIKFNHDMYNMRTYDLTIPYMIKHYTSLKKSDGAIVGGVIVQKMDIINKFYTNNF